MTSKIRSAISYLVYAGFFFKAINIFNSQNGSVWVLFKLPFFSSITIAEVLTESYSNIDNRQIQTPIKIAVRISRSLYTSYNIS